MEGKPCVKYKYSIVVQNKINENKQDKNKVVHEGITFDKKRLYFVMANHDLLTPVYLVEVEEKQSIVFKFIKTYSKQLFIF